MLQECINYNYNYNLTLYYSFKSLTSFIMQIFYESESERFAKI